MGAGSFYNLGPPRTPWRLWAFWTHRLTETSRLDLMMR